MCNCGHKYRGLRTRKNTPVTMPDPQAAIEKRPLQWRKGRRIMVPKVTLTGDGPNAPVTVAQDVVNSPSAPVPNLDKDASTGFLKSVIETGDSPLYSLGDTRTQPVSGITVESPVPQATEG